MAPFPPRTRARDRSAAALKSRRLRNLPEGPAPKSNHPESCDFFWFVGCVSSERRPPRSASLRAGSVEGTTRSDFPKAVAMVVVNDALTHDFCYRGRRLLPHVNCY